MITATFFKNEKIGVIVEGHAGFKKHGADIVCAAVTVLVHNTLDSILTLTNEKIDVEVLDSGYTSCFFNSSQNIDSGALLLFNSMKLGLSSIEKQYKKYIQIIEKEV